MINSTDALFVVVTNEHTFFGPFTEAEAGEFGKTMLLSGQSVRIAGLVKPRD